MSNFFRFIALYALLYQIRFIAGDLADTAVFSAALLVAAGGGLFTAEIKIKEKKINTFAGLVVVALIPWVARAFIAMPRIFVSGPAVGLDALLLNFDRNNFVSLLPFYWAAASTFLAVRSRLFLRAAVIVDALLLIAIAGIARISDLAIYRLPIVMIITLAGIVFFQALALLFSLPPELKIKKTEKAIAVAALLLLVSVGGLLFLKPSQRRAAQKGGGLLEPKLFSFDFSQVLRLDTEISMNDDLVLIVKKDPTDNHILMRRSVMSGYSKKQGFYRVEEIDERTHPQRLPSRPTQFHQEGFKLARQVRQEYFVVNFDAAAFIGMKEPLEIIPYENWDSSSFKSAYLTESLTSDAAYEQYSHSTYRDGAPPGGGGNFWPGPADFGLSDKEYALYTAYGNDDRIRELAEEITAGYELYGDKVEVIYEWLKYGDFRYSLKPGIAPDGDQLAWFLFHSKKGYCSYYAFAMTLLLRSIGIPARIAAGFFLDPENGTFDYYQVRSDMAHAWVEVPFPGYGWIEFDPTTENLAEGEEFRFSTGVDPQLFERLMREILENRSRLRAKTGNEIMDTLGNAHSLASLSVMLLKKILLPLTIASLIVIFMLIRCGFWFLYVIRHDKRARAVCLWKHARRRLRLAGFGYPGVKSGMPESEWASRCDTVVKGTYALYLGYAAARFSPEYQEYDFTSMQNDYRLFSVWYRKVPLWRRLLAWILPPLAFVFKKKLVVLLFLVFLLVSADGRAQDDTLDGSLSGDGDEQYFNDEYFTEADELFNKAADSEYSEYWERAIDLYKEGRNKYPDDARFPLALGNLFFNRSLYSLAWDEYRIAEQLVPSEPYILQRMAHTA
ncbi:MAG: transglutaminase-like domain-containing protein, partial [Treponema sp.]|nr:transglutaminase-like domain-containing protein [Treponema sp.]